MDAIVKITIKGCSGYVPADMAYVDKFTITPDGMNYEYKPCLVSENNRIRKWSYKTNSPIFQMVFEKVTDMMPDILSPKETFLCTDVGMIDFTVTYSDKSKKHIRYWGMSDIFSNCFACIRDIIPQGEMLPEVLRSYDEDEENEKE